MGGSEIGEGEERETTRERKWRLRNIRFYIIAVWGPCFYEVLRGRPSIVLELDRGAFRRFWRILTALVYVCWTMDKKTFWAYTVRQDVDTPPLIHATGHCPIACLLQCAQENWSNKRCLRSSLRCSMLALAKYSAQFKPNLKFDKVDKTGKRQHAHQPL